MPSSNELVKVEKQMEIEQIDEKTPSTATKIVKNFCFLGELLGNKRNEFERS